MHNAQYWTQISFLLSKQIHITLYGSFEKINKKRWYHWQRKIDILIAMKLLVKNHQGQAVPVHIYRKSLRHYFKLEWILPWFHFTFFLHFNNKVLWSMPTNWFLIEINEINRMNSSGTVTRQKLNKQI